MILAISAIIFTLVAFNFLLLKFSCNRTSKKPKTNSMPIVLKPETPVKSISRRLAPTGS